MRVASLGLQHQLVALVRHADHQPVVDGEEVPILGNLGSDCYLSAFHLPSLGTEAAVHLSDKSDHPSFKAAPAHMIVHRDDHFDGAQVDLWVSHVESWSPPRSTVITDVLHLPVDEAHVPLVVLVPGDLVRAGGPLALFS